jgi:hypothetical protein
LRKKKFSTFGGGKKKKKSRSKNGQKKNIFFPAKIDCFRQAFLSIWGVILRRSRSRGAIFGEMGPIFTAKTKWFLNTEAMGDGIFGRWFLPIWGVILRRSRSRGAIFGEMGPIFTAKTKWFLNTAVWVYRGREF